MSIQMVNGFACANCAEASLAKRGVDPHEDPNNVASSLGGIGNAAAEAAPVRDSVLPQAVPEAGTASDVRAKLDYAHYVDKLI